MRCVVAYNCISFDKKLLRKKYCKVVSLLRTLNAKKCIYLCTGNSLDVYLNNVVEVSSLKQHLEAGCSLMTTIRACAHVSTHGRWLVHVPWKFKQFWCQPGFVLTFPAMCSNQVQSKWCTEQSYPVPCPWLYQPMHAHRDPTQKLTNLFYGRHIGQHSKK